MPTLNIGVENGQLDAAAPLAIYSTMLFPEDFTLRQQYFVTVATSSLKARGALKTLPPAALATIHDAALNDRLHQRAAMAEKAGFVVGQMFWVYLYHVQCDPKHATLNRVSEITSYYLSQRKRPGHDLPAGVSSNPAKIRERYWQKYESVAHLWAGSIQAEAEVPIEQKIHWLKSPQECLTMLATSEKLLEMLAGHHPRNRNSPAVDALRAWRAPSRNLLPLPEVVVGPIMEEWKRLISEYNPET